MSGALRYVRTVRLCGKGCSVLIADASFSFGRGLERDTVLIRREIVGPICYTIDEELEAQNVKSRVESHVARRTITIYVWIRISGSEKYQTIDF
jgi:hypothetical protein